MSSLKNDDTLDLCLHSFTLSSGCSASSMHLPCAACVPAERSSPSMPGSKERKPEQPQRPACWSYRTVCGWVQELPAGYWPLAPVVPCASAAADAAILPAARVDPLYCHYRNPQSFLLPEQFALHWNPVSLSD